MRRSAPKILRRQAVRVEQGKQHPLYLFTLTADDLMQVADISRISRDDAGKLVGYQRPEVKRHIRNIVEYLNSDDVLFPNSLIIALPSTTRFRKLTGARADTGGAVAGTLEIRLPHNGDPKPAWIVDGQQRALALSKSRRKDLPVPVNAFLADDIGVQRDQFLRINSTKPLPRGLITELLPEISTLLPPNLAARKAASALCEVLSSDPESPFRGLIRRSSYGSSKRGTVVSDTSLVKILHDSLTSPAGCLFAYRNLATGQTDFAGVRWVLLTYWNAVHACFPEAWGLPPSQSRLMHSAGLRAMGRLMDRVMGSIDSSDPRAPAMVKRELAKIRPACRWTSGRWEELGGLRWNEVQNVPSHVRMLSNFVIRTHLAEKRGAA